MNNWGHLNKHCVIGDTTEIPGDTVAVKENILILKQYRAMYWGRYVIMSANHFLM